MKATVDVRRWAFNIRSSTLDVRRWAFDVGRPTLDLRPWTLDLRRWTLDVRRWTFEVKFEVRPSTLNVPNRPNKVGRASLPAPNFFTHFPHLSLGKMRPGHPCHQPILKRHSIHKVKAKSKGRPRWPPYFLSTLALKLSSPWLLAIGY